jgi:putative hydrolase of the HAD superfamily
MTIKHISFDMWNTLIKPNPEFSKARNDYIAQLLDAPEREVKQAYTESKMHFDRLALQYGHSVSVWHAYSRLIEYVAPTKMNEFEELSKLLMWGVNKLFEAHPPTMSDDTFNALLKMKAAGYGLSIGSNTNFISGMELKSFLKNQRGIPRDTFRFQLYSDQAHYAKPHWTFFQKVYNNVRGAGITSNRDEILHIGDDFRYDGGARTFGFLFRPIATVDDVAPALEQILNGEV